MLPYAFAAAAKLKGARSVLIMHDLYPDVLVMAGLLKPHSMLAKAMRALNALMFRALDAVVIIGRDTEQLLLRYRGMTRDKIRFIPNWATLARGVRAIDPDNPYRRSLSARFVVGLSGNLGFTHDPVIVFEAARLLRDDGDIHFLLSGWGVGFDQLKADAVRGKASERHAGRSRRGRPARRRFFRRRTSGSFPIARTSPACRCPAGSTICWRSAAR